MGQCQGRLFCVQNFNIQCVWDTIPDFTYQSIYNMGFLVDVVVVVVYGIEILSTNASPVIYNTYIENMKIIFSPLPFLPSRKF